MFDPRFRTGHLLDAQPSALRYLDHPELSSAAPLGSDAVDLRPDLPPVTQQLVQNCCAHALSVAAFLAAFFAGTPIPLSSVLWLYALAQLRARPRQPLLDIGSSLGFMSDAVAEQGLVSESEWLESRENVGVVPPDDVFRSAAAVTIVKRHWLPDGAATSEALLAALRRQRASTVCCLVDEAFAAIGPGIYNIPGGRVIGSHAMLVVGYVPSIKAFIVRNSWGRDFGDEGYALVSERFMNLSTYGKLVFDAGPMKAAA